MTIRIPAQRRPGAPEDIDDAPVWRPARVGAQTEALPAAEVQDHRGRPLPVFYTPLLGLLVCVAATYGLLADDAYRLVSDLTRQTWRAQDAVTLVTIPALLYATRRARRGSLVAHLVSVGILIWLTYGYAHLAIGAPFNAMFLVYVAVLTLAGFAMLDGLLRVDVAAAWPTFARVPRRGTAWFLAITGIGIGALWLSEIVVALPGGLPTNIHLAELPNPTWVLDLGWIIPSALTAALMLGRRHPAGPVIAGAMLVMLLILSATMLAAVPFALAAGLGADPAVSHQLVIFTIVFTTLGGIETWLLACAHRRLSVVRAPWLRRGWWPEAT